MTVESRGEGSVSRPVLFVTRQEYAGVAIGYGGLEDRPPPGERPSRWQTELLNARWGLAPDGERLPPEGWRELQRLAEVGRIVREAGCGVQVVPGPLSPMEGRLEALTPHCKEYLAARRRPRKGRDDPDQKSLFGEAG
jgi:hypothetical protein